MDVFKDCAVCFSSYDTQNHTPRFLPCGHSICTQCLKTTLNLPLLRKCPLDNQFFPISHLSIECFPLNFALLAFLEQKDIDKCKIHIGEKLKLVCLTDKRKLCDVCVKSGGHNGHTIKKIKELKVEGIKVKAELESTLLQIKSYEESEEDSCEMIRKKFLTTLDEKFKEMKKIVVEKHFELNNYANNLFNMEKEKSPERIFALKQQLDETIKDIAHACSDHGDVTLLEKALNNGQNVSKMLPQVLKEKSEGVRDKFLHMQKSFEESLNYSRKVISILQLPSQEVIKEMHSMQEGRQQLSEIELHQKLKTLKFSSYFDVKKTLEGLEISMWPCSQPKEIEVKDGDFKTVEAIDIKLGRYDLLMRELMPNVLTYIFRSGLDKLISLEVSFDSKNFNSNAVGWLANIVTGSIPNLKSLSLDFEKCYVYGDPLKKLCDLVFSKIKHLKDFFLYLNSSYINNSDLQNLLNEIKPFCKNFECFAIGLADNYLTDNEILEVYKMIQNMDGLKNLQLILSRTRITDKSLEFIGENLLPQLKALDSFTLSLSKCQVSDKGVLEVFKSLKNLRKLELFLPHTQITDKTVDMLIGEVKPRLVSSLKSLTFIAKGTKVSKRDFWEIHESFEPVMIKTEE